jgi:hypothetical protein
MQPSTNAVGVFYAAPMAMFCDHTERHIAAFENPINPVRF